jgi:hypothetical protein
MTAIDYLAAVAGTGTVAGVGLGASPEQIRDALGSECVADRRKKSLRLDYGLLEFNLFAGSCENIAIQAHRLADGVDGLIPAPLLGSLDGIAERIVFDDLRGKVEDYFSCRLEEVQGQGGYRCYRIPEPHVLLYVVEEGLADLRSLRAGDLWSIMISGAG